MYDGLGWSTMLATDPPTVTASAASGQRRSSKTAASRAQPNITDPHMIMGASSPPAVLTAIVTAVRCLVVCLQAYAPGLLRHRADGSAARCAAPADRGIFFP